MTGERTGRRYRLAVLILLGGLLLACQQSVLNDLEEGKAARIVSTLQRHGIAATKKLQDAESNTWRVQVPADSVARALDLLNEYNLLTAPERGFRDIFGERSTISTATEEQALFLEALQGEIAQSLQIVDRVIDARVNLSLAEEKFGEVISPATASVVIVYQPTEEGTRPITDREVQGTVANAVANLDPERVSVIMKSANISAPPRLDATSFNPYNIAGLVVAESSVTRIKILLGIALVLIGGLAAFVFWQSRMIGELRRELSMARTGYMPSEQSLAPPPEELPPT